MICSRTPPLRRAVLLVCGLVAPSWALPAAASDVAAAKGDAVDQTQPQPPTSETQKRDPTERLGVGVQSFWAQGKVMPGAVLRGGTGLWSAALETSLIWLTSSDPSQIQGRSFLGNQIGFFVGVSPLHTPRYELGLGMGGDLYLLWNIHADERDIALALRAYGHVRLASNVGLFATARSYLVSSKGMELGTHRDGSSGLPLMFSTGAEWCLP